MTPLGLMLEYELLSFFHRIAEVARQQAKEDRGYTIDEILDEIPEEAI
mgnify:FL=1